jgi:hypothetical protein
MKEHVLLSSYFEQCSQRSTYCLHEHCILIKTIHVCITRNELATYCPIRKQIERFRSKKWVSWLTNEYESNSWKERMHERIRCNRYRFRISSMRRRYSESAAKFAIEFVTWSRHLVERAACTHESSEWNAKFGKSKRLYSMIRHLPTHHLDTTNEPSTQNCSSIRIDEMLCIYT